MPFEAFTERFGPLIVFLSFAISVIAIRLWSTRVALIGNFWSMVDVLWVASSVIAFYIAILSANAGSVREYTQKFGDYLAITTVEVALESSVYTLKYCSEPNAKLYPHSTYRCDKINWIKNIVLQMNALLAGKDQKPLTKIGYPLTVPFDLSDPDTPFDLSDPDATDWFRIAILCGQIDSHIDDFNQGRASSEQSIFLDQARTLWIWVFPFIGG